MKVTLQQKTLDLINMAKAIVKDTPMDLREIYYEAEARQFIIASSKTYVSLKNALITARKRGLFDPALISTPYDRQPMSMPPTKRSAKQALEIIKSIPKFYQIDNWDFQPNYIEVWVEKITLCKYFRPICEKFGVILIPCKGDQAISAIWDAKKRFDKKLTLDKKVKILYFGDFNPSGVHAPIAINNTFKDWNTHNIEFKRIALLFEDIAKYNLPPNPTKKTTKKDRTLAERFIAKYGADYNVELDSLKAHNFDEFIGRIESSILKQIDIKIWNKSSKQIATGRKRLEHIVEKRFKDQFPFLFSKKQGDESENDT